MFSGQLFAILAMFFCVFKKKEKKIHETLKGLIVDKGEQLATLQCSAVNEVHLLWPGTQEIT